MIKLFCNALYQARSYIWSTIESMALLNLMRDKSLHYKPVPIRITYRSPLRRKLDRTP